MIRPGRTLGSKLFLRLAPTILLATLTVTAIAFFSARYEINHAYDAQLIVDSSVLWTLMEDEIREGDTLPSVEYGDDNEAVSEDVHTFAEGRMFRIWQNGKIVSRSDTALPPTVPQSPLGLSKLKHDDDKWRIFAMAEPRQHVVIEVGEKTALRNRFMGKILAGLALPLLILIPSLAILLWVGINNGLGAIRLLVQQLRVRSPDDLSPIDARGLPDDLLPLSSAINRLLEKLGYSLDAERRFADHAAHQLRTPLAGLKLQLQMLTDAGEDERTAILNDLTASADRAAQLVAKLLTVARVSHQDLRPRSVRLYELIATTIANMSTLIAKRRLDIGLEGDETAVIETDETLLAILITNLLENAVKFTPAGGEVKVALWPVDGQWRITVEDTGPGIPEHERVQAFEKFYRLDRPQTDGTGLGLAIVADIAQRLNAKVTLETPENGMGLRVVVLLPAA